MSLVFYLTNEKMLLDCVSLLCWLCVVSLLLLCRCHAVSCLGDLSRVVMWYSCLVSQVTVRVTVTVGWGLGFGGKARVRASLRLGLGLGCGMERVGGD
jgi:hypothetical protein